MGGEFAFKAAPAQAPTPRHLPEPAREQRPAQTATVADTADDVQTYRPTHLSVQVSTFVLAPNRGLPRGAEETGGAMPDLRSLSTPKLKPVAGRLPVEVVPLREVTHCLMKFWDPLFYQGL